MLLMFLVPGNPGDVESLVDPLVSAPFALTL